MAKGTPVVFIVSTFVDLEPYREAVQNAVLRAGALSIMLQSVGAVTAEEREFAAKKIREADAVVLIVGHMYGPIDRETGKSLSEIEYEVAKVENKDLFVFVAADDTPWPPTFIDTDRSRIEAFRAQLVSDRLVRTFSSLEDLRIAIVHSLTQWIGARNAPDIQLRAGPAKLEVKIVHLLLSSPGDVGDERERVAHAVFRFNQHAVEESGLFIKLVRWEDMAPQIGPKAQTVINKQIGQYHMFCGIMWNRFGTPTDFAASGTKEEFDGAVQCWKAKERPWITFYFCDRAVTFTTPEQLDQKRMVLDFRKQLSDMGVVRTFQTAAEFEDKVFEDLKRIVRLPEFLHMLDKT